MAPSPAANLKIVILTPSLSSIGGVQAYTRALQSALQRLLGEDRVRLLSVPAEPEFRRDGAFALAASVKLRFAASALAAALCWSPNLIICTHIGLAPVAQLIQALTDTPFWLVLHGIEVWGELSLPKQNALRAADCLVTTTEFTLSAARKRHSLDPSQVLILPPCWPQQQLNAFTPGPASSRAQPPVVLTVGRLSALEKYKGHDVMLEAWPDVLRRIPDAEYWIVGGGDDRPRLEARAQELGIAPAVRFLGSVSPEKLAVCYDRCCIFAMPAKTELDGRTPRGEGFGIVFLEAMVRGKPVVGPREGAPAEFIRSGEHGLLVDPESPVQVANAIIDLLADPIRASRMGAAAREWAISEFSFDRFCERLRQALPT